MKNPFSLKLLHLLTIISYWVMIVLITIVAFMGIIIITLDPQGPSLGFSTNLTHFEEVLYLESEEGIPIDVALNAGEVKIPVKYMDTPTQFSVLLMSLTWMFCVLIIVRYFKTFMKGVLDGVIFQTESIYLLKKAALGLVVLDVIELIMRVVGHFYVKRKFDLGLLEYEFDWGFPSFNLIFALTLWALAHIFQKGKELEEEQKLTV